METKKIFIWSGGYDSTLLLTKHLMEHEEATAWSFIMPGISQEKLHSEHNARERYKEYIKEKIPNCVLNHQVINIGYDNFRASPGGCLQQQTFWLLFSAWYAPKDSTIVLGFHKGDDFWLMHDKINWSMSYIFQIMEKTVNFEYPLQFTPKWKIVDEIHRMGLRDYVWTCERPPIPMSPCSECPPCFNLRQALNEIEYQDKKNRNNDPITIESAKTPTNPPATPSATTSGGQ